MGSMNTMSLIAETFVSLTEHEPPEKIAVSDIVAASGKNRKTFYYHFVDKNHLIAWIFRCDLGMLLHKRFDENLLVYEHDETGKDPLAQHPYYMFNKKGVRSLDQAGFFRRWPTVSKPEGAITPKCYTTAGRTAFETTCTGFTCPPSKTTCVSF